VIEFVLDSSAILAELLQEPGAERVAAARPTACISAVNYSEIIAKLIDGGLSATQAEDVAEQLRCDIFEADKHRSVLSGLLHEKTRRRGISLGDRYCLQLAMELRVPVLTTDRLWASLGLDVEVVVIR
jgi:PIN domain nuclease of toxin-antitoxin system